MNYTTQQGCNVRDFAREDRMVAAYLAGFTMVAIGAEFGVSGERVRQIIRRAGVSRSDRYSGSGFIPFDPTDLRYRYGWSRATAHWWRAHHRHKATRRRDVRALRGWVATTRRTEIPMDELLHVTGEKSIPSLARRWGRTPGCTSYAEALDRLCRFGGVTRRPQGGLGHAGHEERRHMILGRQRRVVELRAQGLTAPTIANMLGIKAAVVYADHRRARLTEEAA